jgi:hypothetical protein
VDEHQRGLLNPLDDVGHRERLTGAGDPQQRLVLLSGQDPGCQLLNGLPLITTGFERSIELERRHGAVILPRSMLR